MNLDPATGLLTAGRIRTAVPKQPRINAPLDDIGSLGAGGTVRPTTPYAGGDPVTAILNAPPSPVTNPTNGFPSLPSPDDLFRSIQSDPLYQQAQADVAASRVSDLSSRGAARQRALALYGAIPDFAAANGALGLVGGDIGNDVTDTTRQLADQNTKAGLSTTARLDLAHNDMVKQIKDALTARGLLSSGETGYQLGRTDLAYRQNSSDALQQLLDLLSGYNNSYLAAENQRRSTLAQEATAAAGRVPYQPYYASTSPDVAAAAGSAGGGDSAPAADAGASYGLIPAMQTPQAAAWRERGQRGEYIPLD